MFLSGAFGPGFSIFHSESVEQMVSFLSLCSYRISQVSALLETNVSGLGAKMLNLAHPLEFGRLGIKSVVDPTLS